MTEAGSVVDAAQVAEWIDRGQLDLVAPLIASAPADLRGEWLLRAAWRSSASASAFCRALLDAGTAPDPRGEAGETPLLITAILFHVETMVVLLAAGASPDAALHARWSPEGTPYPAGHTPRRQLDVELGHQAEADAEGVAQDPEWQRLARALGVDLGAWIARLSAERESPIGRWTATRATDDEDNDVLPDADPPTLTIAADGTGTANDPTGALLRGLETASFRWSAAKSRAKRGSPSVKIRFDDAELEDDVWRLAVSAHEIVVDVGEDPALRWTFQRE